MDNLPPELLINIFSKLNLKSQIQIICSKKLLFFQDLLYSNNLVKFNKKIPGYLFGNIRYLSNITNKINIFPPNLFEIKFADNFNNYITNLVFPDSLRYIIFGKYYNKPVLNLPNKLIYLKFGNYFDQPVNNIKLPDSLEYLIFGKYFNQKLDKLNLSQNLLFLKFGTWFNKPVNNLKIPNKLNHIIFGESFNKEIDSLINSNIKKLEFPGYLDDMGYPKRQFDSKLPKYLIYLKIGSHLDDYYRHLNLDPESIKNLIFFSAWNWITPINYLNNLTRLELYFSHDYKYTSLTNIKLPISLKILILAHCYNYPLESLNLELLINLEKLKFGFNFNKPIKIFPVNLKKLVFGYSYNKPLNLPNNLEILVLPKKYNQNIKFPKNIKLFKIGQKIIIKK